MSQTRLRDRVQRGFGIAARKLGGLYDAHRPSGPVGPVSYATKFLRLNAAFTAGTKDFTRPPAFGNVLRWGMFDSAYTRAGDYLVGEDGTFFIAGQQDYAPPLCVRTERMIDVIRPQAPSADAGYGGISSSTVEPVLSGWPAAIVAVGTGGRSAGAGLVADAHVGGWVVMLPVLPVSPLRADLLSDDLGRGFVVNSAERSEQGWRMLVTQTGT